MLNCVWLVLAVVLLILHYVIDGFPIWPFWLMIGLYVLVIGVLTAFVVLAVKLGNEPEPERENKNPYSVGANKNPYSKTNDRYTK